MDTATDAPNGQMSAAAASTAPLKWTLVEAEPEASDSRRVKQQGYSRQRNNQGASTNNWRYSRDSTRGRGFSGSGRGGGRGRGGRNHAHGQGRGRGYGSGYSTGPVYYSNPAYGTTYAEQKRYMTEMAVRQIEFYFTVENLCRDIFMRSYMDEEGYIPIAFVANFPGVARFGVDLEDIKKGVLASEFMQVDIENETMRMREGWEVWLLPNQATGRQGVPRYVKIAQEETPAVSLPEVLGSDGKVPENQGNGKSPELSYNLVTALENMELEVESKAGYTTMDEVEVSTMPIEKGRTGLAPDAPVDQGFFVSEKQGKIKKGMRGPLPKPQVEIGGGRAGISSVREGEQTSNGKVKLEGAPVNKVASDAADCNNKADTCTTAGEIDHETTSAVSVNKTTSIVENGDNTSLPSAGGASVHTA